MIRVFQHYFSGRKLLLFLSETVAIGLSCFAGAVFFSFVLTRSHDPVHPPGVAIPRLAILSIAFVCTFQFAIYLVYFFDMYNRRVAVENRSRVMRLLKAVGVAVIGMGGLAAVVSFQLPGGSLLGGAMGAVGATLLVRARMSSVIGEPARVLVVGRGAKARWLARAIEEHSENAFVICALVDPDSDADAGMVGEHLYGGG